MKIYEKEMDFNLFRSEICHLLKSYQDIPFINVVIREKWIDNLWTRKMYPEAFYVLALVDYLCSEYSIPICNEYEKYRNYKLSKLVVPIDFIMLDKLHPEQEIINKEVEICKKERPAKDFLKYNILERSIRDVI